ncbi:Superfamily II DNA or RNA helicase, SNF2 family [Carboxydocella sporoproducens DSM 16521]|uniref:Superfamily II DNA or RNA helicase, SNF2 family n=2 Tax=Carboxydocella TaxID=178898 RepID=A0A1T4MGQ7_9FIRM|nr:MULTISPECIES: DEAD/DEAH box helicase [Carboxydocella]AVX21329.1 Superfamily II DNA or RNA helicase, SNF2 family [Carboxydocella thermautotrophica]SJZ66270.1 Superfamily II DNA or RNA helicase, SNF2 family [Carboxydocella sporoproducens DSM 16521]
MNVPEISEKQIKQAASSPKVYERGLEYFADGLVKHIEYDHDRDEFRAIVSNRNLYNIRLRFYPSGTWHYYCTCPAHDQLPGICKHVVAVLKALQTGYAFDPQAMQNRRARQLGAKLLSHLAVTPTSPIKQELNLEVELTLQPMDHVIFAYLGLKIGLSRLYVIRDLNQFVSSLQTGQPLEFGQKFTFEPTKQSFAACDQPVIDFLQEMYEQYAAVDRYETTSHFKQRPLPLSDYHLAQLLHSLKEKSFVLCLPGNHSKLTRIKQGLSLGFNLAAANDELVLSLVENDLPPRPLTRDGSFFFYQEEIWQVEDDQQRRYFLPLAQVLNQEKRLIFASEHKDRFATELLPALEKISKLEIAPELASRFIRQPLAARIYFDRYGEQGISARVEFEYGTITINPFSNQIPARDILLVRNQEKENAILSLLELADFTVNQGQIYLDEEEKVLEFITAYLPRLQELAEIFYSEEFKKLRVRPTLDFSGRVRLNEEDNLLEVSFTFPDLPEEELREILASLQEKKKYHRLKDGSFLLLQQQELQQLARLLENLNLDASALQEATIQLPKYRAMYLDSFLRQHNLPNLRRDRAFKQLVQSILEPQDNDYEVPASLQKVMRDYQKTGFRWLKTLAAHGLGGILADDMGLGKTLQVLAFLLSEQDTSPGPSLVIAPTSLVYNWEAEARKFAPELKVLVVSGSPKDRQALLENLNQWDLVITSYGLIRRDIELYARQQFVYCFLDEAQHIKNAQTVNAKSVLQINARSYFALTGTPIENSLAELWSIFNFILPGYFPHYQEFRRKYELPIARGNPEVLAELSRLVKPFILRRVKKDVLKELPAKIETEIKAPLTAEQQKVYLAYLKKARGEIAQELAAAGFEKSRMKILAALTRLRQICCHPALFLNNYRGDSGKFQLFQEVLTDALASGHRVLVFSQFTSMLDILHQYLLGEGIEHFYLHGSVKPEERLSMAHSFNQGQGKVFLISLKAGGTGLNLTGADMVIHYDPWWNPAVEEQATDRAYRIGQNKAVQVIKLISQGTIEEKVFALQQRKKELIASVIQPGETFLSKLTEAELRELFDLTTTG